MQVLAPAKINLHLHVGKRRDDGFHPLYSWMCTVGLFDKLTFSTRARPSDPDLTCNWPDVPTDHRNLVAKARSALAATQPPASERAAAAATPLTIRLDKSIPHGAGLGGGSSDAARTLLALNRFWKLDLGKDQLLEVAAHLGSDLPFFLEQPSAIAQGRGERLTPCPLPRPKSCLLVLPPILMPTPAVYRRFDELNLGSPLPPSLPNLATLNSIDLLAHLTNDLEIPAFSLDRHLRELHYNLQRKLDRTIRMSGSGSALFTLYDDSEEARFAADKVTNELNVRAIPVELAPKIRDDLHENPATRY